MAENFYYLKMAEGWLLIYFRILGPLFAEEMLGIEFENSLEFKLHMNARFYVRIKTIHKDVRSNCSMTIENDSVSFSEILVAATFFLDCVLWDTISEFTQQDDREKRAAKFLCVTTDMKLLVKAFEASFCLNCLPLVVLASKTTRGQTDHLAKKEKSFAFLSNDHTRTSLWSPFSSAVLLRKLIIYEGERGLQKTCS